LYKSGAEQVERIYVNAASEGPYDGKTWDTAFNDLQNALSIAQPDTEIWVATGVYTSDRGTGARTASFHMKNGVRLLGGFAGTETSSHQRDPNNNETILSGDLKGDDGPDFVNNDENSYHVVSASRTEPNALLDGFTITNGNANGPKGPEGQKNKHRCGGGLYNDGGNPTLMNCTLRHNSAMERGGGMYSKDYSIGSPTIMNCIFKSNSARETGGGLYNGRNCLTKLIRCTFIGNLAVHGGGMDNRGVEGSSHPRLIDCRFISNIATHFGGGMSNNAGNPTLERCTFRYNSAGELGGGMYSGHGKPTLSGCVFLSNRAQIDGGGMHNRHLFPKATLISCTFANNSANGEGGGIFNYNVNNLMLINCRFADNSAEENGGGTLCVQESSVIFANCIFVGNSAESGGGMHNDADSYQTLTNCTVVGNSARVGGGILQTNHGSSNLTNCILWGNSDKGGVDESAQIEIQGTGKVPAVNECCIQGWSGKLGGVGNFEADPLFIDPNGPDNEIGTEDDNLCLSPNSPCLNAGDNSAIPADTTDLDGDDDTNEPIPFDIEGKSRILDGVVDIGACEGS